MDYEDILYEEKNGVATITINRPKVYNAFRPRTCVELIDAFLKAGWNEEIGAIVLTGAGNKAFCTGGDQSDHDGAYGGGLSVRTSISPELQAIADRVLRVGLVEYDRRHGWRGPIARLEPGFDWLDKLARVEPVAGLGDKRMAAVLGVDEESAEIGFADGTRGRIPLAEMKWARPSLNGMPSLATMTSGWLTIHSFVSSERPWVMTHPPCAR